MPRPKRICPAGEVFDVLNRGVARLTLFEKPEDVSPRAGHGLGGGRSRQYVLSPVDGDAHDLSRAIGRASADGAAVRGAQPGACGPWSTVPNGGVGVRRGPVGWQSPANGRCCRRCPFGDDTWASSTAARLNLPSTSPSPRKIEKRVLTDFPATPFRLQAQ
jgi:hypothetical protein